MRWLNFVLKMEKLRKQYRTEIQQTISMPLFSFVSSWVHFKRMNAMEKGPNVKSQFECPDDENDNDHQESLSVEVRVWVRIPTGVGIAQPGTRQNPILTPVLTIAIMISMSRIRVESIHGARVLNDLRNSSDGIREEERDMVAEMVSVIKVLGKGS
ncbi:uncharacterized protein LOC120179894 [Hibiscus syriacus]|uniref:uncharacterized protein LOC120179894 n=1 Tax=Hibiscus syriacus TaxID=106335 RepID=UPI0019245AC0|nr:uncharacterized protein LOC120179894 [Hibiscus syriacus]